MQDDERFIKISIIENFIEAQVVQSVLKEQGIPHRIRSFHDTAYDGLFQMQMGWGEIYAAAQYRQAIIDIINSIRQGER